VISAVTQYTTRLLTPDTWDDFAALVEANNGVWGGCWCIGFHPEGISKNSTAAGNREAKLTHVNNGAIHQMLVYGDGRCMGWCQFGPPAEVATIKNLKAYEKGLAGLPDWRIGCLFTGSGSRRKGVARAGVAAVLAAIAHAGGGLVEAYPEQVDGRDPQRGRLPAYWAREPVRRVRIRPRPPHRQVALGHASSHLRLEVPRQAPAQRPPLTPESVTSDLRVIERARRDSNPQPSDP